MATFEMEMIRNKKRAKKGKRKKPRATLAKRRRGRLNNAMASPGTRRSERMEVYS